MRPCRVNQIYFCKRLIQCWTLLCCLACAVAASALEAPVNLVAGAGDYSDMIELSWDVVDGASNYWLFRHTENSTNTAALLAGTTNLVHQDFSVVPGTYYYYWVQASDSQNLSPFSVTAVGYARLLPPANVTAGTGSLTYAVALAWEPVEHAASYQIWRQSIENTESQLEWIGNTVSNFYPDRSAWPVQRYLYQVKAVSAAEITSVFSEGAQGWRRPATPSDYDLDGKADIVLYNAYEQAWRAYLSSENYAETLLFFGGKDYVALAGDYDGDGRADPAVYCESAGMWLVLLSDYGYQPVSMQFGDSGFHAIAGDYDGDGLADPALYHSVAGIWMVRLSSQDYKEYRLDFGGRGWEPLPADYDGDGKTDPALYNSLRGEWIVLFSGSQYRAVRANFGGPWFKAVPADYDGDGLADPAVYNQASGLWAVLLSSQYYAMQTAVWGGSAQIPVPADYDGDGLADLMTREVPTGVWRAAFSSWQYRAVQGAFSGTGGAWRTVPASRQVPFYFLCLGDSITYGSGSASQGPATGYPKLLEKKLNDAFGYNFISINVGISGESTREGRSRIEAVLDFYQPNLVLLMEGINDLLGTRSSSEIAGNLRFMIQAALNRGIPVVLATIPPVISNKYNNRDAQAVRIKQFNPYIYGLGKELGVPIARVNERITSVSNWQNKLMEQESANHPNDEGYLYVRDAFYSVIVDWINAGLYD